MKKNANSTSLKPIKDKALAIVHSLNVNEVISAGAHLRDLIIAMYKNTDLKDMLKN
jgi:hypothetical protein